MSETRVLIAIILSLCLFNLFLTAPNAGAVNSRVNTEEKTRNSKPDHQSSPIRSSLPTGQAICNIQSTNDPVNKEEENQKSTIRNPQSLDPQYTYDLNGNRASMIGPSGETWTYDYDAADRLTKITNPNGEVTTFTYDAIHRRTSITYDNGVVTSYTYDAASRLTNLTTQDSQLITLNSYAYTYDKVHNRTSMTDTNGTHNYFYSDVYRLTSATHPQAYNPDESFTYDPVGNRLSSHLSSNYVYDNLNRLLEDDGYTYTYDTNGNLISKADKVSSDTTTYQYDDENKLIQVDTSTDIVQYQYDGFGRRIAKTVNGVVTKFVYDGVDILFELDENNQIKARYSHGPRVDEPISVYRDTDGDGTLDTTYYHHYDGLGSVTTITGTTGNVVQTYEYDTFGSIVNQTGSVENGYTYTSREWDAEAGLYYYRLRYYDANSGRFIQGDPIGFTGGDVNFYVYVQNNPVNFVDPLGLANYFTDNFGYSTLNVALDVAKAGVFISVGNATVLVGIGIGVGTILEDVATGGLGIIDDPISLLAAYISVREGSKLTQAGINDLINLSNGKECPK